MKWEKVNEQDLSSSDDTIKKWMVEPFMRKFVHIIYKNNDKDSNFNQIEIVGIENESFAFSFAGFPEKAQAYYFNMIERLKQFGKEIVWSRENVDANDEMIISISSIDCNIREIFKFLFAESQIDEAILAIPELLGLKHTEEMNKAAASDFAAEAAPFENYNSLIETIERQIKKFQDSISFFSIGKGKKAAFIKEALKHAIEAIEKNPQLFKSPEEVLNYKKDEESHSLREALNHNRLLIHREKTNTLLEVERFLYTKNS
ncbi:hypothetical protein [Legionella jamestowniensis]|uniref:Uncharacterized protein n=1 Tax=Legionella jamestowniensis TaxID=455 RepID=A0A0W0UGY9_9GAMM|nr:hypothetical protein [Legionella jamestowniensis]KTD07173.1 hypothetical protein Ljam_1368 [Legionella jamestowniensis]SFL71906.1 hypothetical protein SAMN02746073_1612 [Legionella jamestowniensis DSM 19215]